MDEAMDGSLGGVLDSLAGMDVCPPAKDMLDEISLACGDSSGSDDDPTISCDEPTLSGDDPTIVDGDSSGEGSLEDNKEADDGGCEAEREFYVSVTASDLLCQYFVLPAFAGPVCAVFALFFTWLSVFRFDSDYCSGPGFILISSLLVSVSVLMFLSFAVFLFPFPRVKSQYDFRWFVAATTALFLGWGLWRFCGIDFMWYVVLRSLAAGLFGVSFSWNARSLYAFCHDVVGDYVEKEVSGWVLFELMLCQTMTFLLVFKVFFGMFAMTVGFGGFTVPEVISFLPEGA